jgi:hypothetical protein
MQCHVAVNHAILGAKRMENEDGSCERIANLDLRPSRTEV